MEFWKGESEALLKALHILTREGKLNADSRRKLKQVHHLTQLIEPLIQKISEKNKDFTIVDMGAGKSYLGFILYDLILRKSGHGQIVSVESRVELVSQSEKLAKEANFERMKFIAATIDQANITSPVAMVCALHACDTATDESILFGIRHHAEAFALVPCCQAEVARALEKIPARALYDFPIHRREFGSHLTNVIRTLFLQAHGYKVTVTELVGWEHSMKNELILAEKVSAIDHPKSIQAQKAIAELLKEFPVQVTLLRDGFPGHG